MIKCFDYLRSLASIECDVMDAVQAVLHSGQLMLGPQTMAFEVEFAEFVGARHCIGVSSGTVAIQLALSAAGIGPGDEVLTVSNTCVPTAAAVRLCGAAPLFVDVGDDDLMMSPEQTASQIGPRTRGLLPVHLWGHSADLDALAQLADEHDLVLIEDCAQAHGTVYGSRHVGTFGAAGCFSFYPTKNLGCYGDAGAIVTDDDALAERIQSMREYGYDETRIARHDGMNARISELQAAILRVKLRVFPEWLAQRRRLAAIYDSALDHPHVRLPASRERVVHSYHQYVIRTSHREELRARLARDEIQTGIHYPVPVHKMPAYATGCVLPVTEAAAGEIVSLPIHEALTDDDAATVARAINRVPLAAGCDR